MVAIIIYFIPKMFSDLGDLCNLIYLFVAQ